MILLRKICVEELSERGRDFNWGAHDCEKCYRPMWGHGFVGRYVSGVSAVLWMKRYRCPSCGVVVTTRPEGYWPRIRSSIREVYESLRARLQTSRWPVSELRQRAGHWLRSFVVKVRMDFGDHVDGLISPLDWSFEKQISFLDTRSK